MRDLCDPKLVGMGGQGGEVEQLAGADGLEEELGSVGCMAGVFYIHYWACSCLFRLRWT